MEPRNLKMQGFKIKKQIELKRLYTIFKQKLTKDYFYVGEYHDFWELVFILNGEVGITGGKHVHSLKANECFFHRPMEFHRLWPENGTEAEIAVITFSCSSMIKGGAYKLQKEDVEKLNFLVDQSDSLFFKDDIKIESLKDNKQRDLQIFISELENLFLNILSKGHIGTTVMHSPTAEKYTTIIEIMENNIDKRLSVTELAQMCSLSVPNLKKIFKKYSDTGVMEYFSDMKINKAKFLLSEGKSVKETAIMLGFYDQNYFNVFFKRHTGISPGKYINMT